MKFNKKIVVASLSTAMGLSLVGAIGGTVAWYQYSTKTTTSVVATSVANSGVLQISSNGTDWMRDLPQTATGSTNDNKLLPVTFGQENDDGSLKDVAYCTPEAGKPGYQGWDVATAGVEYLQYDIHLRASQINEAGEVEYLEKKVYLSDITIEDVTTGKTVSDALRINIDVENGEKFMISKEAQSDLELYGPLELDGNEEPDVIGGYVWDDGFGEECIYGIENEVQNTLGITDIEASQTEIEAQGDEKVICTTPADEDGILLRITIWLEGWHQLTPDAVADQEIKANWSPEKGRGASIRCGLTFDVGRTF